MKTPNYHI